jgi:hypothetical protein
VKISESASAPNKPKGGFLALGSLHFTFNVSVDFLYILAKIPIRNELFTKEARNLRGELPTQLILFL